MTDTLDANALFVVDDLRRAANSFRTLLPEQYGSVRQQISNLIEELRQIQSTKGQQYYNSAAYQNNQQKLRDEANKKKHQRESLEQRVVEWAEANVQVGDYIKFLGTRGNPWRKVVDIQRTKFPEYGASRINGAIISWKKTEIPYAAFMYEGGSSVNGMEKIAIVVRNGVEVFNRKSVHLKNET